MVLHLSCSTMDCCGCHKWRQRSRNPWNFLVVISVILQVLSESLSMKMIMMDIPSPTRVGQAVELVCNYDLEGETLYSVKWYKDGIEFYRFVPNDWPPGQFLTLPGIRVDLSRSNRQSVYLREVDLDTAGVYRCEVSAEAPVFDTVSAKKEMKVFALPAEAPKITGKNGKYRIGDTVSVNCSSAKSKPAATLRWYINDLPVGPEYETSHSTILHADGLESSTLSLRFVVKEHHFVNSNMRIRCSATIPRVYTMSDEELVVGGRLQQASGLLHISENVSKVRDSAPQSMVPVYSIDRVLPFVSVAYSFWILKL
ncbi:uncharacterized protein LOC143237763 [Tachypleus tridentatus]|uniref:uncharacterized protein LOC143237763 n=1 Tax=Tachypleus tridentatus TaxID=6853 RepID=UPI003FD241A3